MSARNAMMEAALVAAPDDDAACLVYGDWLQALGDPQGELIVLQHALLDEPRSATLRRREAALLEQYGAQLVGSLAPLAHLCEWRAGFVRSVTVTAGVLAPDAYDVVAQLRDLLERPAGLLLADLTVGRLGDHPAHDPPSYQPIVQLLAQAPRPSLRRLHLADQPGAGDLGDLADLWTAAPHLQELLLQGGDMTLGKMALSSLRRLVVRPAGLSRRHLGAILAQPWPLLAHLELWFVSYRGGTSAVQVADLAELMDGAAFPSLRSLALVNVEGSDELIELLAASRLLPRLRALDLSHGTLSDEGARRLIAHRERFAHLDRLDLDGNPLGAELRGQLTEKFQRRL